MTDESEAAFRTKWTVHGESAIYTSDWVSLSLVDVELPDGTRFDHHVVRVPHDASATIVHDAERGILAMWRHRFVTDSWGWEIPAGKVDPGETPVQAAERETLEETGWQPGPLSHLFSYHPSNGLSDQSFHVFHATEATHIGDPVDVTEAERVEWLSLDDVRRLVRAGEMGDGLSLTAVCWYLAVGAPAA